MKRVSLHLFAAALSFSIVIASVAITAFATGPQSVVKASAATVELGSSIEEGVAGRSVAAHLPEEELPFVDQIELSEIQLNKSSVASAISGQYSNWVFLHRMVKSGANAGLKAELSATRVTDKGDFRPDIIGASYTTTVYSYGKAKYEPHGNQRLGAARTYSF